MPAHGTSYVGTFYGGVFKSTNGSGNWSTFNAGLTNTNVSALTIDPATPATLYAGTWRGGLTNTNVRALAIDPVTPTTLYAGTYGGGVFAIQDVEYRIYLPLIQRGQ